MSSWVRQTPISPPKKAEEFNRLPKVLPEMKNTIEEVLPYPTPSRFFLPGSGQRLVDESPKARTKVGEPEFLPISDSAKNDPNSIKTFDIVTTVKSRNTKPKILPRKPEPFVSLATPKYNPLPSSMPTVVRTFDNPSVKAPSSQQKTTKPAVAKYETKYETKNKQSDKKTIPQLDASSNPNITIVIPLYNGVEFLEEALQSIKRQTYQDWKGIIGVNGYGQTGEPVLTKATDLVYNAGLAKRISVINLPDVKGAANAINHMVGQSTTPYIAHIDADDLWLSKKLEYQMSVYEQDPTIGIVGSMCRYFGDSNDFKILTPGMLTVNDFVKSNPLIHSSILIKREFAVYSDEFVAYDYDCWVRNITNDTKIFNINNILVLHRIHSKSFYNTSGKQDPTAIQRKYGLDKLEIKP